MPNKNTQQKMSYTSQNGKYPHKMPKTRSS